MNRREFLGSLALATLAGPLVTRVATAEPFWRDVRWYETPTLPNDCGVLAPSKKIGLKARTPTGECYGGIVKIEDYTDATLPAMRRQAHGLLREMFAETARAPRRPPPLVEGLMPTGKWVLSIGGRA